MFKLLSSSRLKYSIADFFRMESRRQESLTLQASYKLNGLKGVGCIHIINDFSPQHYHILNIGLN